MTADNELVYLRHDTCVRPVVAGWSASDQLIPPVQAALNMKSVYRELLHSYLAGPDEHWTAAHTPALIGGPWVDVEPERAFRVEEFLAWTEKALAESLALADDVLALDRILRDEAEGGSLVPLYAKVPERLRGYVELVYDASHQPSIRFLESLLYSSPLYDPSLQKVALEPIHDDSRASQFTTPLLEDDPALTVDMPFSSEAFDELFAMRTQPRPLEEIRERLEIAPSGASKLDALFTTEAPRPGTPREDISGLRIRYYGHACVLFETSDVSVLVDPVVSYQYDSDGPDRFTLADLPEHIDVAIVTHLHKDHLNFETLLQLRHRVGTLVVPRNGGGKVEDPSARLLLQSVGFKNVLELDRLESLPLPGGEVMALPFFGEHGDLDAQSKAAFLVRLEGTSTLCAADSSNIEPALYSHLNDRLGDIDILFIGMECVGAPLSTTYNGYILRPLPRRFDQERRTTGSGYDAAMGIIDILRPRQVYVYAMGLEPWLGHLLPIDPSRDGFGMLEADRLVADCNRRGITAARPYCTFEITPSRPASETARR